MRLTAGPLLALALASLPACVPSLNDSVRNASREAVYGTTEGLANLPPERATQVRAALLRDLDVNAIARELAKATVEGGLDAITETKLEKATRALVTALVAALREQLGPVMDGLEPRFQEVLRRSVTTALAAAMGVLRAGVDRDLERWTHALVQTSVETLFATLQRSEVLRADKVGPWAERIAHDAAQGAMAGAVAELKKDFTSADLRAYLRESGVGLTEGLRDGLNQNFPTRLESTLIGVTVVLGAIAVALIVAARVLWRELKVGRKTLAVVAAQINQAPTDDESRRELKRAIRESAEKNQVQGWLSTFLKDRGL